MQLSDFPAARVLIVMMSAVGDSVHVLPVIHALKRHDPAIRVTWVLQPLPASLMRGHPLVDEIIPFDPALGARAFAAVGRTLRAREFDVVIDLQVAFKAGLVTAMARAPLKIGFDRRRARDANWLFTNRRIPPHAPQHVQDQYFEFLHFLGVSPDPVEWRLGPWDGETEWREFVAGIGGPYAALNVATSNPDRDWLPDRWAAVVDALWERYGVESVLVGGRSARELAAEAEIAALARHRPRSALGSGFRNLVGIMDGAALAIALDSAPLHVAVAVGTPVISLMANADPRRTGPYRRFHDLIVDAYHDPGETAPVSMVRRWGRMGRISVDDVLDRVALWDRAYRSNG